jgi:hypothetical protein
MITLRKKKPLRILPALVAALYKQATNMHNFTQGRMEVVFTLEHISPDRDISDLPGFFVASEIEVVNEISDEEPARDVLYVHLKERW